MNTLLQTIPRASAVSVAGPRRKKRTASLAGRSSCSVGLAVVLLLFCDITQERSLAVEAASTLLLYDTTDADSVAIKDYYLAARPGVRAYGLSLPSFGEEILAQEYLDDIRRPILEYLNSQGWGSEIDTFVTTKGLPLRIDAGADPNPSPQSNWARYSSLESELTRIDTISSVEEMGDQNFSAAILDVPGVKPANPYYLGLEFDLFTGGLLPYEGPEGFDRSDPVNENIRLTSRLDGYTLQDVFGLIDRSQKTFVIPFAQAVVVDDHPGSPVSSETEMTNLALNILPSRNQLAVYDATNSPILASSSPVIGYVSLGTHSGLTPGGPGNLDQTGYIVEDLNFEYANGAVFLTYESFNAYSFDSASVSPQTYQGQVAQWIAAGGTAAVGNVAEPTANVSTVTNEDIMFDMLLSGYTLAEAAWAATRQLSFVNTVVGDPLMVWRAWLPGDTNLDGVVEFNDFFTLQGNWQQEGGFEDGDFDGDGMVDENDLMILQANWLTSVSGVLPGFVVGIAVTPALDAMTNEPVLDATLMQATNLNGDLDVDGEDAQILWASFGVDDGGDADGDGDTDGADFLLWQQQFFVYSLTADFDIDGEAGQSDLSIWENSFSKNRGGDADGDGDTDGADFLAWQREFTNAAALPAAAAMVPEPSTGILAGLAFQLLTLARRRQT